MGPEKTTILVVDDDSFVREMLCMILETSGYAVATAENGAAAFHQCVGGQRTDLIVSDMNMPQMNGLELIRKLRENNIDTPLIILTGNNEISVAVEALNSGATDYLLKDENIQDTVILSVEKSLEKYRLKKQNIQLLKDLAAKNCELEASNKQLIYLDNLKNKFLGIAAHDLRNPLTSIRGLSEILIGEAFGPLTADQKEYLTVINTTSDEMLSLVNDLLDVSVIESGKLELHTTPGSLKDTLEARVKIITVIADRKGILIEANLAPVPDVVFDSNRISQVIDNLVSNAIKFSPANSTIRITLAEAGNGVRVSVRDEGPGIPPEDRARLFKEFQRLSAQPTAGEKTTGLGLAIVKKIVDAHGGSLEVESEVGRGSIFSFTIPLKRSGGDLKL